MSSPGTNLSTTTSNASPTSPNQAPTKPRSKLSEPSEPLQVASKSFGYGNIVPDGKNVYASELKQKRIKFSSLLRREMKEQGKQSRFLSTELSVSPATVKSWRGGIALPTYENAVRLADAMNQPRLMEIARIDRDCLTCNETFIVTGKTIGKAYCSRRCSNIAGWRRKANLGMRDLQLIITIETEQNDQRRTAIADFCDKCTLGALCPDASCPLRPVSPIPLEE
jgi:hypothetical protein